MNSHAENPCAAAQSKPAGAELRALFNLTHGMCALLEDEQLDRRDIVRLHDLACKVVQLTAAILSEAEQRRLPL
jgi:hypothetical protein